MLHHLGKMLVHRPGLSQARARAARPYVSGVTGACSVRRTYLTRPPPAPTQTGRQLVCANSLLDGIGSAVQRGFHWLSWSDGDLRQRPPSALDIREEAALADLQRSLSTASSPEEVAAAAKETAEELLQEKYAAVRSAYHNGKLGFGFSAGGLLFPYYVGFISGLTAARVLRSPAMMAGASAGSLIAAAYNAGLDMPTVEKSMVEFGEDCLKNGTRYRLGPLLREFLEEYMPPDAHERCEGNTHVAVTRVLPYFHPKLITQWDSREDFISCLLTSCHIPWYLDGRWMTKFRGHYCVDGGVTNFVPKVPDAEYTVRVMCFPSWHLEALKSATGGSATLKRFRQMLEIDVSLDTFEEWPYDAAQVLKWALLASPEETSNLLIDKGKRDAAAWVAATGLDAIVQQQLAEQQQQQHGQQPAVQVGTGPAAAEGPALADEEEGAREKWIDHKDRHDAAVKTLEMVQEGKRGREEEAGSAAAAAAAAGAPHDIEQQVLGDDRSASSSSDATAFAAHVASQSEQQEDGGVAGQQAKRAKMAAEEAAEEGESGSSLAGAAEEAQVTATSNRTGGRS